MSIVGPRPQLVRDITSLFTSILTMLNMTERLLAYADMIQSAVQQDSSEVIRQLVEERKRQRLTQQELSDITGVRTSNIARFEGGTRIPTLLMLEKYANALGKHIEVSIRDKE